jgi:hypothetical protein
MSMRRVIQTACLSLVLAAVALVVFENASASDRKPSRPDQDCEDRDARLLSALNDSVQKRFKEIDGTFGYRRIIRVDDTPHRFKPESAKEFKDVDDLKKEGLKVFLYVAGRRLLEPKPEGVELTLRKFIKGPGFVTADPKSLGLPSQAELWDEARKAMLAFENTDAYNFTAGRWKFSARVVRASDQSCLDCHGSGLGKVFRVNAPDRYKATLRIGDPLGVVLYGYERSH